MCCSGESQGIGLPNRGLQYRGLEKVLLKSGVEPRDEPMKIIFNVVFMHVDAIKIDLV